MVLVFAMLCRQVVAREKGVRARPHALTFGTLTLRRAAEHGVLSPETYSSPWRSSCAPCSCGPCFCRGVLLPAARLHSPSRFSPISQALMRRRPEYVRAARRVCETLEGVAKELRGDEAATEVSAHTASCSRPPPRLDPTLDLPLLASPPPLRSLSTLRSHHPHHHLHDHPPAPPHALITIRTTTTPLSNANQFSKR